MGTDQDNVERDEPKGNGIAQHSSASNEHYTPSVIVDIAREVMGSIELDPASCALANRKTVCADRYFSKEDDGLSRAWDAETIFVNPPGGKLKLVNGVWQPVPKGAGTSSAQVWWHYAVDQWQQDRSRSICFLGFTLELLRLSQRWNKDDVFFSALRFPFCVLRDRTDFLVESAGELVEQGSPTHANVLVCITAKWSVVERFADRAQVLGDTIIPYTSRELFK